ncbi:MAG: hypothetical protein PHV36_10635 [Elusimicrobiales bacterium]|nr:hypothetical protein [Elusimicrobiales bacterium]
MLPRFWKLSQGVGYFSYKEILDSIDAGLVYVNQNTKAKATSSKTQAQDFIEAPIGDYFYLTHGNRGVYLFGQFSGPANIFSLKGNGWLDRPFRLIRASVSRDCYKGASKWWAPSDNSTFTAVPDNELAQFEKEILAPYFEIKLKDFDVAA